jgi:hypothetical protein
VEALGQQSLLALEGGAINKIVQRLEELNPIPSPLHSDRRSALLGDWELVYASRGTVVTPSLTGWTGVTIKRAWQTLKCFLFSVLLWFTYWKN